MMVTLHLGDCLEYMRTLPAGSVDAVVTDPPYQYLVGHRLDRPFDERIFFSEVKRILKKDAMVLLFGRGTAFYRWNIRLAKLGFKFKEEIVWDKAFSTSPLMAINRVHETVSIHSIGKKTINKTKVPYLEAKGNNIDSVIGDVKRMKAILNNTKSLDAVLQYLENNSIDMYGPRGLSLTVSSSIPQYDRAAAVMRGISQGMGEKTIIRTDRKLRGGVPADGGNGIIPERKSGDRACNVFNSFVQGMNEKTIIKVVANHYKSEHPTQKPVGLMVRLLKLVSTPGDVILDPFLGSGSTAEACVQTGRNFIGCEIDPTYFAIAEKRIALAQQQPRLPLVDEGARLSQGD